eukprot:m.237422 g.237422  ORF g.237422 m.237422 type:complete len:91 (+) comp13927_c1_seq18:1356-1628(+)
MVATPNDIEGHEKQGRREFFEVYVYYNCFFQRVGYLRVCSRLNDIIDEFHASKMLEDNNDAMEISTTLMNLKEWIVSRIGVLYTIICYLM